MARILVIDDDALVREATKVLLHTRDHEVTLAENDKAGVEAARSGDFDLAIVDLFMPDMDGLHVIETIHRLRPNLPLIAASGFMFKAGADVPTMPNFEPMAVEAGAVATLYKPYKPDRLFQAVAKALATKAAA